MAERTGDGQQGAASTDRPPGAARLPFAGFALEARIGLGGSSDVWRGVDVSGRPVACKRLLPHLRADADARARIAREIHALRALAGAAVPAWIGGDVDGEIPWLATSLVCGPTWKRLRGAPDEAKVVAILGLWRALATLHARGWLHGDLAPGNVAVDALGQTVLLDLGLSCRAQPPTRPADYPTPAFASPEAARGHAWQLGSDVFAAASLSHWLLCDRSPARERGGDALRTALASEPPSLQPDVLALQGPLGLAGAQIVQRCWASRAADRPAATAVLATILASVAGPVVDAGQVGLLEHARACSHRLEALPVQAAEDRGETVTGDDDIGATRARF